MSAAAGRLRRAAAALPLAAALALTACGGEGDSTTTTTVSDQAGQSERLAAQASDGFNAQGIYRELAPGVVTVRSVFDRDAASALGGGRAGQGSGFIISKDGEIVTNAHVVTDGEAGGSDGELNQAEQVFVEFADRNQVPAEIVGADPHADVALLKIDPEGLDVKPLELGDSDQVEVGNPVAAIGSPFGQDQSLSTGIVSATDRSIESLTPFRIDGGIQTDASINPGNSGGPLIGADGKVIGIGQQINTTSGGNEGVGFAVPVNLVERSVDQLRDDGEAEYAYIGVRSQALYPQLAERLEIDAPTGSLIAEVTEGSPADEAGLEGSDGESIRFQGITVDTGGDVIVSVDGREFVTEYDLSRLISAHEPGEEVTLEVIRDGERRDVDVTLGARPDQLREPSP